MKLGGTNICAYLGQLVVDGPGTSIISPPCTTHAHSHSKTAILNTEGKKKELCSSSIRKVAFVFSQMFS